MMNRIKWIISGVALVILLGLFVISGAWGKTTPPDKKETSKTNTSASSGDDVGMSNMTMPKARTATKQKEATSVANQVVIENFSFAPATLTVKAGTKVTWINRDDVPHTVDENERHFRSGTMDTDDQYSYTFSSPGTFGYFCALHPKMTGQIIVK